MFEKFLLRNSQDFRTRYQGTFGFFKDADEKLMLCKLTFVEGVVTFVNKQGSEYTLLPDKQEDVGFLFLPPKAGYFNTDEGAVYVERVAQRQFSRGISDRNTKMFLVSREGFRQIAVNFKYLEKVYDNTYSFKDALTNYLSGKTTSLALGDKFVLSAADQRVYLFGTKIGTIGTVTKDCFKLKLDEPELFRTELNDAVRMHGVKVEVMQ